MSPEGREGPVVGAVNPHLPDSARVPAGSAPCKDDTAGAGRVVRPEVLEVAGAPRHPALVLAVSAHRPDSRGAVRQELREDEPPAVRRPVGERGRPTLPDVRKLLKPAPVGVRGVDLPAVKV